MEEGKQKLVAGLTIGGGVAFFAGIALWFVMMGGGAAGLANRGDSTMLMYAGLPIGIAVIGLVVGFVGLFLGFRHAFSDDTKEQVVSLPNVYVMNCLILDKKGDTIFDPGMYDPEELFYYVQLEIAPGIKKEFRTVPEVFGTIGEGMRGTASVQGKWLGQFVPNRPAS